MRWLADAVQESPTAGPVEVGIAGAGEILREWWRGQMHNGRCFSPDKCWHSRPEDVLEYPVRCRSARQKSRLGQPVWAQKTRAVVVAYTSTKNVAMGCLTIQDLSGEISVRAACSACLAMPVLPLNTAIIRQHHLDTQTSSGHVLRNSLVRCPGGKTGQRSRAYGTGSDQRWRHRLVLNRSHRWPRQSPPTPPHP
jgi:hypothetical protein